MSKIVPTFYLPKEYPEDMMILAKGLVAHDGQTVKDALPWLEDKLVTHKARNKKPAGTSMSAVTIKNYLAGFYVLDIYKADGKFYSETKTEKTRASIYVRSKIEAIEPLENLVNNSSSAEIFEENLTQICSQHSQIVKDYNKDRAVLDEKELLPENPRPGQLKELLLEHCGYDFVGNPGVGYLDLFYRDKISIDNYLNLLDFIVENYEEVARKSLGLVPVAEVLKHLKQVSDYTEEDFNLHLSQLRLTHRVELIATKSRLAENIGIDLVEISGIKYGFLKVKEPAFVS
jgi:hypothetical protein